MKTITLAWTFSLFVAALGFGLLALPTSADSQDKPLDDAAKLALANEVRALFREQCWSCHGEPGKNVYGDKGTLDYILNHEKLLKSKHVDLAKPEESELYLTMLDGDMPRGFDDAGKPKKKIKLAQDKIDLVLRWLKAGAPRWAEPAVADPKIENANKVYELLKGKCWSCHGEPGKKVYGQRGKLNFILDHDKLVKSSLVNLQKPEESLLYEECSDGNMPRKLNDGGQPRIKEKLPQADLDALLKWLKDGAPRWTADQPKAPEKK